MTIIVDSTVGEQVVDTVQPLLISNAGVASGAEGIDFDGGEGVAGVAILAGAAVGNARAVAMDGNDTLIITATGQALGTFTTGADGILVAGTGNNVSVAGYVFGFDSGITASGDALEMTISATGVVQGGSNGNGNDFDTYSAALAIRSPTSSIINNGEILGDFNPSTGQRVAVVNADNNFSAANPFDLADAFVMELVNSGLIRGDIVMAAGNDTYVGQSNGRVIGDILMGDGEDVARGGSQRDVIFGGAGDDLIIGAAGDDNLSGESGNDTMNGGDGDDNMSGSSGLDVMIGARGDDTINGGTESDTLRGSGGDDSLLGQGQADRLFGGVGEDSVNGSGGADTLNGGAGDDTLRGSFGADRFDFVGNFGADRILDFNGSNFEKINLTQVLSINSFADLVNNHLSQTNAGALIDAGNGNTILLVNFNSNNLNAGDFII